MLYKTNEFYGRRFRFYRESAHKTQKEVCAYLGVTQSALSKYESGKLQPPFDVLLKMKELYKVPIDIMLGAATNKEILRYMRTNKFFKKAFETYDQAMEASITSKDLDAMIKEYFNTPWKKKSK